MRNIHPKSGETPNSVRATWARSALNAFSKTVMGGRSFSALCREDQEDVFCDLICDALHLAQGRKFDAVHIVRRALDHFTVEREQEGRKPIEGLADILAENPLRDNPAAVAPQPQSVGAALAVAVGGIASLVTQLEGIATGLNHGDNWRLTVGGVATQGRALLNRLGHMVKGDRIEPPAAVASASDLGWMLKLAAQFIEEWADDDGKGRESAAECADAKAAYDRVTQSGVTVGALGSDAHAVVMGVIHELGPVARFILDGEFNGADRQTMSDEDARTTARDAVQAVRNAHAALSAVAFAPAVVAVQVVQGPRGDRRKGDRREGLGHSGPTENTRGGEDRRTSGVADRREPV